MERGVHRETVYLRMRLEHLAGDATGDPASYVYFGPRFSNKARSPLKKGTGTSRRLFFDGASGGGLGASPLFNGLLVLQR